MSSHNPMNIAADFAKATGGTARKVVGSVRPRLTWKACSQKNPACSTALKGRTSG